MLKILLIEDDRGIATALVQALNDYEVVVAETGQDGLALALDDSYALAILDLNLPDITGLDVCKQLRLHSSTLPILILSSEARVLSKINLLEAGADDYLTKPFSLGELKVRIRALLRRNGKLIFKRGRLSVEDLSLDSERHRVERAGQTIRLRRKEFALLECLMQQPGSVVSRQTLTSYAWQSSEDPWANTVDVHIKYLRDKIDRPFSNPLIKTVHGLGYKLEAPEV